MSMTVRTVEPGDEDAWMQLYRGYRSFYRLSDDPGAVTTTWQWVRDGQHGLVGLVAVEDDRLIALANLRSFARPSTATIGLYLDDLFTAPEARGRGAAGALLGRAAEYAGQTGCSVVRWVTAADNVSARSVYDAHAEATQWVTYEMRPTV
ncbi:GNAT family N-acetyltransferase [Aeromicrobium camelliae]|uniref:GNAT family N-acetyltransferase n=1 Tax=Aeromicrobium camelliae TaxID=1538144 RepID=A0A3N6W5J8_9ACTN|nr:GNAT family N-acetyltransferase [Aeromicrobium camelliae]RQN02806.1 GNAT family N-acetyltransferase [Aeromicrobium camelliae]